MTTIKMYGMTNKYDIILHNLKNNGFLESESKEAFEGLKPPNGHEKYSTLNKTNKTDNSNVGNI